MFICQLVVLEGIYYNGVIGVGGKVNGMEESMTDKNRQKRPYPLGAHVEEDGIRFAFVSKKMCCGVLLFDRRTGKKIGTVPFSDEDRVGNIYCKTLSDLDASRITYQFYEEDRIVPDRRARVFPGKVKYGKERPWAQMRAGFLTGSFDWGQDKFPRIPYDRMLGYCMHVRGFTRHISSNVKNRGTFAGIAEKIPYLKEIGVTTLELQPAYEFTEMAADEELLQDRPGAAAVEDVRGLGGKKLNYWGYKKGYYYAPKAAYAASEDPTVEFKALVKALHENGMELIMQLYFPRDVKRNEIAEIVRFWVLEYHVDGFHLLGEDMPAELLAADEALADTKLWYYHFDTDHIYERDEQPRYPHVAEYNDAWYYDMRRFLKGDEGMLNSVLYHMRHIPEKAGSIHYLTNYFGFTLADLVAYDYKHNEANGEDNRDGNDSNCSWNCGEEGPSRRQKVKQLRTKQIKNAMCLLLLSQSTPLIFMGDEFGNTQRGNNNPYCQDNSVTWLDWNAVTKNAELLDFWKQLVHFRREHPILHPRRELKLMDYMACGYPDLSYHGQSAWRPQTESYFRYIGILLCGRYAETESGEDTFLYLAVNMHWEDHELALPRPPKGMVWRQVLSTAPDQSEPKCEPDDESNDAFRRIPCRSISVYVSAPAEEKRTAKRTEGKAAPAGNERTGQAPNDRDVSR